MPETYNDRIEPVRPKGSSWILTIPWHSVESFKEIYNRTYLKNRLIEEDVRYFYIQEELPHNATDATKGIHLTAMIQFKEACDIVEIKEMFGLKIHVIGDVARNPSAIYKICHKEEARKPSGFIFEFGIPDIEDSDIEDFDMF